jgi:hypothetical protein
MLGRESIARLAHIEEHPSVFQHGGARMPGQELFQVLGEFCCAQVCNDRRHEWPVSDARGVERNHMDGGSGPVLKRYRGTAQACSRWWRLCQAYRIVT